MKQVEIAIVGVGAVGSTIAYTLMMRNLATRLILVDSNELKCKGQMYDLSDIRVYSRTNEVVSGTFKDAGQADIAIIAAGIPQAIGQSRIDLLQTNIQIIDDIIYHMQPLNPELKIIVVTNPVDILTFRVQAIAKLPKCQVFGSGTLLDTIRVRNLISEKLKISPTSINLYTLAEHGDSQLIAWSSANICGIPLSDFYQFNAEELAALEIQSKNKAYDIIKSKGATVFGVSACVADYCVSIINDTKQIVPVSCYVEEFEVCFSIPAVLCKNGIGQILMPKLNKDEVNNLKKSSQFLKQYTNDLL